MITPLQDLQIDYIVIIQPTSWDKALALLGLKRKDLANKLNVNLSTIHAAIANSKKNKRKQASDVTINVSRFLLSQLQKNNYFQGVR